MELCSWLTLQTSSASLKPKDLARIEEIQKTLPPNYLDVHKQFTEATARPDVTMIFGEQAEPDASDARWMADVPGVRMAGIPNSPRHDSIKDLLLCGLLEPVLNEFVATGKVSPALLSRISTTKVP